MAPLIALITGFTLARLLGVAGIDALDGWQPALRVGLALMFLLLLAMFPANISAARRHLSIAGRPVTPLLPRTALQLLFLTATTLAALPH